MNEPPRSRRALPWGLLGMIVLVAAIERLEMRDNLDFMDNVAVSWKYTGQFVNRKARGKSILCFGDSLVKFGVLPKVLREQTGRTAYSLALQSGSAPSSYFLLRRALNAGAKPDVIVVDFARGILGDGPASITRPYPWSDLLTVREACELCWQGRDSDLFASIVVRWLLHSDKGRYEVRANILTALRGERTGQCDIAPALWRNWNMNDGGQANPKVAAFDDNVVAPWTQARPGTWRCHPVNDYYVEKFLELAASRKIKVFWLLPPVTPGTLSQWQHTGDEQLHVHYAQRLASRFSNLVVIDGRSSGYQREVFVDGVHLDRDGATALSLAVGQVVREQMNVAGGPQWVKLPDFRGGPTKIAVEDVGLSRMALIARKGKTQR